MIKLNEIIFKNSAEELNFSVVGNISENSIKQLYEHSLDWIKSHKPSKAPCNPAPERHPYKDELKLNKNFRKFIIGSFPPHTHQAICLSDCTFRRLSRFRIFKL